MSDATKVRDYAKAARYASAVIGACSVTYWAAKQWTDSVSYCKPSHLRAQYDFIVVGAGVSGSVVARRLAELPSCPWVLLVEAGPPDNCHVLSAQSIPAATLTQQRTTVDWHQTTEPQRPGRAEGHHDRVLFWPHGRVCGGSSVLNYGAYVRGDPRDFDSWAQRHGCEGWDWRTTLPFWKRLEDCSEDVRYGRLRDPRFRNAESQPEKRGPLAVSEKRPKDEATQLFMEAALQCGYEFNHDYNAEKLEGVAFTQFSKRNGRRETAFRSYVAPLFDFFGRCRVNLHVLPYAQATRLLLHENHTVIGVNIMYRPDASQPAVSVKVYCDYNSGGEVVLSAGAVRSPAILMRSGIGPQEHLEVVGVSVARDIPGVGANLQDHYLAFLRATVPMSMPLLSVDTARNPREVWKYLWKGEGWLTSSGLDSTLFCHSEAKVKHGYAEECPMADIQIIGMPAEECGDLQAGARHTGEHFCNVDPETCDARKREDCNEAELRHSLCVVPILLHPKSRGTVRLRSKDPNDFPVVQPNYLADPYDRAVFIEALRRCWQIATAEAFEKRGCGPVNAPEDPDALFEDFADKWCFTCYHPAGTCKMGNTETDDSAVCDAKLSVRGFRNLRVADASVMPHLTSGNTQAPCYLIGEMAAHFIGEKWETKD